MLVARCSGGGGVESRWRNSGRSQWKMKVLAVILVVVVVLPNLLVMVV